jgi:hypothetical protein
MACRHDVAVGVGEREVGGAGLVNGEGEIAADEFRVALVGGALGDPGRVVGGVGVVADRLC